VKIRLLPEIDLARIAVMSADQARVALKQMKSGWAPYSYSPTRQMLLDILNVEPGELGQASRTEWAVIERRIVRLSKSEDEKRANLAAAKALYSYSVDNDMHGRQYDFFPLALGMSAKVSYWSRAVLSLNDNPLVVFIDPRRTKGLTARGRQFVFSAMHERVRASDSDFAEVRLGIFQFINNEDGSRTSRLFADDGIPLFSFDEIGEMVRRTYEMWFEVLDEREAEVRRKGTGTRGPLI
jgi:hypothetical protein